MPENANIENIHSANSQDATAPVTSTTDVAAVAAAQAAAPQEPTSDTAALRLELGRTDKVGAIFTIAIAALTMIGPFSIDMIFPGFGQVKSEFLADSASLHQITSAYLFAFAVMSIFHGPLSDALGRKTVMTASLSIYIAASLGAALAQNLTVLIIFRIIQGLSAGGATIISRVVIRDLYGGAKAQKLMSQVMMLFALAPAVAPVFGGWILLAGPWRFIFAAMMLYALIAMVTMLVVIPETLPKKRKQPFRAGAIFSSLYTVAKSPVIWRLSIALGLSGQAHFLFISAAPEVVPNLLHLGEQDFWVLFAPIITGMITGSYLVGRLATVVSRKQLISVAFIVSIAGSTLTLIINLVAAPLITAEFGLSHVLVLLGPAVIGMGASLMMSPVQLEILDMFPARRGAATSLSTFVTLCVAAILPAFVVPVLGHSLIALAYGALALSVSGTIFWILHLVFTRKKQTI